MMKRTQRGSNLLFEGALERILDSVRMYSRAYKYEFGEHVGTDTLLGQEYIRDILESFKSLLDGPTGSIDCGQWLDKLHEVEREVGVYCRD